MKKKMLQRTRGPETLIYVCGSLGCLLLLMGISTSLLSAVIGSFLLAGAITGHYENRISRSRQIFIMAGAFSCAVLISFLWLGFNEAGKRACFPEGDCAARHQFNTLEGLDHKIFGLYRDYPSDAGFPHDHLGY